MVEMHTIDNEIVFALTYTVVQVVVVNGIQSS